MATINDILTELDAVKPNQYDDDLKITWLSKLERMIVNDVILTHKLLEDEEYPEFNGYTENDMSAELIVPDPYSELYTLYLMAQIDFYNNETDRYADSMIMFNNSYRDFTRYFNRTHLPLPSPLKLF